MAGVKQIVPLEWKVFGVYALNRVGRLFEKLRYLPVRPKERKRFYVVSSERHAGWAAEECLESVYRQNYDRERVRHVYIDDASTDDTPERIEKWLATHPDHNVEYVHREKRVGGCANNLFGFRMAVPGSIVLELNGDDWLPDPDVIPFLNCVYADDDVWMTYNSRRLASGEFWSLSRPYPRKVIEQNAFRDYRWFGGALQSFRAELLRHLDVEKHLTDPETGDYWSNADDMAFYWCLFEMAGEHSRHLYRINYVYNIRSESEAYIDPGGPSNRAARIRRLPRCKPLDHL